MDTQEESHQQLQRLHQKLLDDHGDHKDSTKELADKVKQCGKAEQHIAVEKRVAYLEKFLGESAESHDDHKVNMETRLEFIEGMIGDSAEKHAKEINAAKDKLRDLHAAVSACAKTEHHSSLEIRMETVEAGLGGATDKVERTMRDLESAMGRVKDLQLKLSGDGSNRDQHAATIEERLGSIEGKLANDGANQLRKLSNLESSQTKLQGAYQELNGFFRDEKTTRDINQTKLDERLAPFERMLNENLKASDEVAHAKIRELHSKTESANAMFQSHKQTTEQRLAYVENLLAEGAGPSYGAGMTKDMEQRFAFWQEDQKRSRDVLESSIQEQLHLEHAARDAQAAQIKEQWERDMKARQAYQESYKELLSHERVAREGIEATFASRLNQCEQQLANEAQRLWLALDGHTHDALEQPPPPEIIQPVTVVATPRIPTYTVIAPRQTLKPIASQVLEPVIQSPPVPVSRMFSTPGGSMTLGSPGGSLSLGNPDGAMSVGSPRQPLRSDRRAIATSR
jgi:hypothetical protein